jgi:hypothetical protein
MTQSFDDDRVNALLERLLVLPRAQRGTALGDACADEPALRQRIEHLLALAEDRAPRQLDRLPDLARSVGQPLQRPAGRARRARGVLSGARTRWTSPVTSIPAGGSASASPRQAWMDAIPASFADRSLPLNIANARGWSGLKRVCL